MFQFQYGAIKTRVRRQGERSKCKSFNSNMVRLRRLRRQRGDNPEKSFQFQYGAIKTLYQRFILSYTTVSIPIWCD